MTNKSLGCYFLFIILEMFIMKTSSFDTGYLTSTCNGEKEASDTFRLESSTGITYLNNMDCKFTVTVPTGERVLTLFRQFEFENPNNGDCVDYVNFYDGDSTTSAILNFSPFCSNVPPANVTSSGNKITLQMITDPTGTLRGFELLFVPFTLAPCDGSKFGCSNGICVPSSGRCDGFNQCGDDSDEAGCTNASTEVDPNSTGLIVGMVFLAILLIFLGVVVGIFCYRRQKLKKILREFQTLHEITIKEPSPSYPITEQYTKKQFKLRLSDIDSSKTESEFPDKSASTSRGSSSSDILRTPST